MEELKFSIITPSLNQGRFIEECIESVLSQKYDNFEHIIIDACSTDNTVEILKKYPHLIWISEKDKGQSDALNKALALITGDVVGWLNADDYYCPEVFIRISKLFLNNNTKWIVGNLYFKYEIINKLEPLSFIETNYKNLISDCDIMRTQATFFRKSLIDAIGRFDIDLHMVMDYDIWLKAAKISPPLSIEECLCVFRVHADQKTTFNNYIKQYKELFPILIKERAYIGLIRKTYKLIRSILKMSLKSILIYFKLINKDFSKIPYSAKKIK